jgi:hypothetical protein
METVQKMNDWNVAQSGELEWHKTNSWRSNSRAFYEDTIRLMRGWGFGRNDYESVIDVGAGPRLRSKFFKGKIIAIEPLAFEYLKFPWCDLCDVEFLAVPIEQKISNLRAEFVISLNCLDHCQDFDKAIENISGYADRMFLSYDCGEPNDMHPLALNEYISLATFKKHGLKIDKMTRTVPYRAGYALNWWLSK